MTAKKRAPKPPKSEETRALLAEGLRHFEDQEKIINDLRARIAALEAPTVVPRGFIVGQVLDHDSGETTGEWDWGFDISVRGPDTVPAGVYRALAWAAEHNQRPPHESDKP